MSERIESAARKLYGEWCMERRYSQPVFAALRPSDRASWLSVGTEVVAEVDAKDAAIAALKAKLSELDIAHRGGNLSDCPVHECDMCGILDCPRSEPLHYHHDGCPACDMEDHDELP